MKLSLVDLLFITSVQRNVFTGINWRFQKYFDIFSIS